MKYVRETLAGSLFLRSRQALYVAVAAIVCSPAAQAVGFSSESGEFFGSWDTTLSYGMGWRLDKPSPDLIGTVNGGTAYSVNGDDGTLNFQRGKPFSRVAKITSELEMNYKSFGAFFRGSYFYDIELMNDERQRTQLPPAVIDSAGRTGDLLDAFMWYKFDLGPMPAEIRIGEQVANWGESTFIQGGNNVINHINVGAIRVPGAELREALLPQDLFVFSVGTTENTSLDLVYQYDWDDTEPDAVGTYFASNDFVPDGGAWVRLAFGDTPDFPNPEFSVQSRPFNAIPRAPTVNPEDGGQYGAAFRLFAPKFNNGTEFGFYYYNYHSRLPLISARTGTVEGLQVAAGIGASAGAGGASDIAGAAGLAFVQSGGDRDAALAAGVAAANPLVPDYAARGIADTAISGGNVSLIATAYATDAFANTPSAATGQTAAYFTSFPEDIQLIGASFNTTIGTWAWQGEWSLHMDKPLQVDDLELLFAGLSALRDQFAEFGQLGSFSFNSISPQFNENTPPLTIVNGYRRMDVSQFQATATKLFGPVFGATQGAFLFEGAVTHVHRMPEKDVLRFNGPGTYVSGNAAVAGIGHPGKPFIGSEHFADATSYGYRLAGFLDYNGIVGPVNLQPRFSWQHDLRGVSPGPAGNFLEGRKALTLGLRSTYQEQWEVNLNYTTFFGGGQYNLTHDRDFIAFDTKYNF